MKGRVLSGRVLTAIILNQKIGGRIILVAEIYFKMTRAILALVSLP